MKKLVAMLLSLSMMACLFAGCGDGSSSAATSEKTSQPVAEESQQAPEQKDEAPAAPETEPASEAEASVDEAPAAAQGPTNEWYSEHIGVKDYDLPMFEDGLDLSIFWVQLGAMGGAEQPLKKDLLFWQRVQEKLGVTLTFKQASEAVCNEQYNLMIASGDMTDLIYESNCGAMGATSVYNGGYDKAIEDDVYVDRVCPQLLCHSPE